MSSRGHRSPRIVVIGSINMDLVVRCASIARPGETISGQSLREIPGGKGANQAVAAARLGAQVTMVGRVGDDAEYTSGVDANVDAAMTTTYLTSN